MESRNYLLLSIVYLIPCLQGECPYKECTCPGYISCNRLRLNSIPVIISRNTTGLTILGMDANRITTIPAGRLPSNLKEISFLENPITIIEDSAFNESATTLEKLSFSNAYITRIPNAFLHLTALRSLTIFNARIIDWNQNVMINIGNTLEKLYLVNAGVAAYPGWIIYFSNLTELSLDGCSISSLPNNSFDSLTNSLQSLSLFNNSLIAVPGAVGNLSALSVLVLQRNQIVDISSLPTSSKLVTLTLNNNNISDHNALTSTLSHYSDSLVTLTLTNNHLTVIPNLHFLTNVGTLDFSHNPISDSNSGSVPSNLISLLFQYNNLPSIPRVMPNLTSVTDLIVSHNSINQILGSDFPPSIKTVNLEHNLITTLTDTSFPNNSDILFMNLNNNPISVISPAAFSKLNHLKELRMQNTKVNRLPLSFVSLTSLYFVDMTNSTELICTCSEKGLETWIVSFYSANVVGNCGETSIFNFFTVLSPSCPT